MYGKRVVHGSALPVPPVEMRRLVGTEDVAWFENRSGDLLWPFLDARLYQSVFDFGCGCGRLARQLLQQRVRPERYLGIDAHLGMVRWCQDNLSPLDPNFVFAHHDTALAGFNPGPDKPHVKAFDAPDAFATLAIAWSVFTHLVEYQAEFYLREIARVLRPDGAFIGTWFTFDKRGFPMMQTFQNTLYVNPGDPSNAAIHDREWLRRTARAAGLTMTRIDPPPIRGEHWWIVMTPSAAGLCEAEWPEDAAPYGNSRPPLLPAGAHLIGVTREGGVHDDACAPSSASLRERYDRDYYLHDCGGYAEFEVLHGRKLEDRRLAAVHALAAARPGDRVLDIGCGRGELAHAFALGGAAVTAVDYSEDALALAREVAGDQTVRFVAGDATAFTDPDGFDIAVASDVIEHLAPPELDRLYRNAAEMLRPSGSLVVHTWPNAWMYRYGYPRRRAEMAQRGTLLPADPRTPYERAMHINEQSPHRLRRQLRRYFPHVLVWLAGAEDPRGSLARRFTCAEARDAPHVYAYASHRPIDAAELVLRVTTERLDLPDDAVEISNATAPARVRSGAPFAAEVTLHNRSDAVLSSFMPHPVRFAYLWLDAGGARIGGDQGRSLIAPAALPHESRRHPVRIEAPQRTGRLTLRLTVVQELVRWFGARADLIVEVT